MRVAHTLKDDLSGAFFIAPAQSGILFNNAG
jgi:hypothetical protein